MYSERLWGVVEDAYPSTGGLAEKAVIEQQLINIFVDGLLYDYLKMKVLRESPKNYQDAVSIATKEQNIRKRFTMRQDESEVFKPRSHDRLPINREVPMEVDHYRPKRCARCKRLGHLVRDCKANFVNEVKSPNLTNSKRDETENSCWHCGKIGHFRRHCPSRTTTKRFNFQKQGN